MTTAYYVIDGKEFVYTIKESLVLKNNNLYLNNEKIFETFKKQGNIINNNVFYNDVDITQRGRELFKIPEDHNNHFVKIIIQNSF